MKTSTTLACAAALAVLLCLPLSSHAIFRAYLSSAGKDTDPCTLQQPCRLLPRALEAVDDGGEIWMLDSGNYNTATVVITKSVAIQAVPGAVGSVVAVNGNAVEIPADNVTVALRNLVIAPFNNPTAGLLIGGSGAQVHVDRCTIFGMGTQGIVMPSASTLYVLDSVIRDNGTGVRLTNGMAHISRARIVGNSTNAVFAGDFAVAHVSDSVLSGNAWGLVANGNARVHVTRTVASGNVYNGFQTQADGAFLEVSDSNANGNGWYGIRNISGTLHSAGNNRVSGNGMGPVDGAITAAQVH